MVHDPRVPAHAEVLPKLVPQRRIPRATYRLQLNSNFTFRDACALVPYLHDLGISDCYLSPILKARPGSQHGYDICDHSQLNPDLGSEDDFSALSGALRSRGMGLILDTVPNHMVIGDSQNSWWFDVLEIGPTSSYAAYFDIDWHPVKPDLDNKVLLPILDDQYGRVLEDGKLQLIFQNGAFFLRYYDVRLPLAPRTYSKMLARPIPELLDRLGEQNEHVQELQSILTALSYLPSRTEVSPDRIAERVREKEIIKKRIAALCNSCHNIKTALDETLRDFNGQPGDPHSFDPLDELIEAQPYRLAFWKVATEEINYRRFFDINDLAAIRVELPEVFQATHQLLFRLVQEGKVSGLRIDHPDGLWDPFAYLRRIQDNTLLRSAETNSSPDTGPASLLETTSVRDSGSIGAAEEQPTGTPPQPLFVVAEKILSEGESLPEEWPVDGTTGYDFLAQVNRLFVDSANGRVFDKIYHHFIGAQTEFRSLCLSAKKMVMLVAMAGEINALSHQLDRISEKNRRYRDFTLNSLTFAIREVIACLPIYRTYLSEHKEPSKRDQDYIESAVAEAKKRNPRTARAVFDFIRDTLLFRNIDHFHPEDRRQIIEFVMKFQQVTAPVMAKGVEDTVFYVYNRLVSLNEVGSSPGQFGSRLETFHAMNTKHRERWPHTLLATSTHDTKRSEDVRARISVLSEIPREWNQALTRWSRMNARHKTLVDGEPAPDRNDEYLLYQTLLGAWPSQPLSPGQWGPFRERITGYMLKAAKEAKVHTSWINPNDPYDAAVQKFTRAVLAEDKKNRFLKHFATLQQFVSFHGRVNALSQLLLKLTSPGVPDIYQGTELWDDSLVDPDNRRPVDYNLRRSMLASLRQRLDGSEATVQLIRELLDSMDDGRIKLYLTYRVLNYRRDHEALFSEGDYVPLVAFGEHQHQVCAFARTLHDEAVLVVTPRLTVRLSNGNQHLPLGAGVWQDGWLAVPFGPSAHGYRNVLTGERICSCMYNEKPSLLLSAVFSCLPMAILERLH